MKGEIQSPHDKFFRSVMSDGKVARSFLEEYLPEEIKNIIDFNTLYIEKDSFVEKKLKDHRSDLLYSVQIKGKQAYLYLLFEHKSRPEKYIGLQLLKYMVEIWKLTIKQRKTTEGHLPVIIPIVIYHGRGRWEIDVKLKGFFEVENDILERYIPNFEYILKDLSGLRDEDIKGEVILRISLLAMKYIYKEEMRKKLPMIFGLLKELSGKQNGLEYLETLLRYIVSATDKVSIKDLEETLKDIPEGGKAMPTIAEQWLKQGIEKGKREGIQEGIREGIQEGIREGLLEGIELGLKLKLGTEGLKIYPKVARVEDIHKLRAIKSSIETASSVKDIEALL
ncbi:MAG: transposase [Spirochaetes bacterium]|nr:MAG: transposase [Spirochaetota bacterium]